MLSRFCAILSGVRREVEIAMASTASVPKALGLEDSFIVCCLPGPGQEVKAEYCVSDACANVKNPHDVCARIAINHVNPLNILSDKGFGKVNPDPARPRRTHPPDSAAPMAPGEGRPASWPGRWQPC